MEISLLPYYRQFSFSRWTWVSWYHNISIVDFVGELGAVRWWRWW